MSNPFSFETTGSSGNTAEFFGIWRNNMPRITRIQLDASGDGMWGMDNIEYGTVPEPGSLTLLAIAGVAGAGGPKEPQELVSRSITFPRFASPRRGLCFQVREPCSTATGSANDPPIMPPKCSLHCPDFV